MNAISTFVIIIIIFPTKLPIKYRAKVTKENTLKMTKNV